MRASAPLLAAWAIALAILALLGAGCASLLGADFDRGGGTGDLPDGATGGGDDAGKTIAQDGATTGDGGGPATCTRDDVADCVGKCGELKGRCGQVISCGGCAAPQSCGGGGVNQCGTNTCTPNCADKACGENDGCSSVCATGACGAGLRCVKSTCTCDTTSCNGCCDGNACKTGGDDTACGKGGVACAVCAAGTACGTGDCGTCGGSGQACCAGNQCGSPGTCGGGGVAGVCGCTPNCAGKACGTSDGCGGTCNAGSCASGLHCTSGGVCACDGTSCSGCCGVGQCMPGTAIAACGAGGAGCTSCPVPSGGSASCSAGACGASCNTGYTPCGTQCCKNKIVFVATPSGSLNGNLGGLSGADTTCQTQADGNGLSGATFKAWLSDSRTSAATRLTHAQGPYVLRDGVTIVADDWNDLVKGSIRHDIDMTAASASVSQIVIRTGTTTTGAYSGMSCKDWTSGANADGSGYGQSNFSDAMWTQSGSNNVACDYGTSIYCIEQ